MKIPCVCEKHIGLMYRLFTFRDDDIGLRLNYIEPIKSVACGVMWKVEYRVKDRPTLQHLDLKVFVKRLHQAKNGFDWLDVYHNFDTRIYLYVRSSNPPVRSPTQEQTITEKVEDSSSAQIKSSRPQKKKPRDAERAQQFQKHLKELKKKAVSLGYTDTKDDENHFIPKNERKKIYEKYIRKAESKLEHPGLGFITFKKGETINPALEHAEKLAEGGIARTPVAKMTAASIQSSERRYAKSRLLNGEIFKMVRAYLSVLSDRDFGIVTTSGESRLGLELRLKSEGLPIGDELLKLYKEALSERGYTTDQIDADMSGLRSYEQTSRLIRLQSAREKAKQWYGLKGGSVIPVEREYYHVNIIGPGTRSFEVEISDDLGQFSHFN